MSLDEEDDFWNSSDVKAFNFDDEEQASGSNTSNSNTSTIVNQNPTVSTGFKTLGSILAAKSSSNEPFLKPSIIMCPGDKIEELIEYLDKNISNSHSPIERQDPKLYIRDIVFNKAPIDFSPYKSKREKLLLLDCAICCSDGNAITAVTIFISKTLKTAIFIEEMKKRPVAMDHYVNYLEMTGRKQPQW